VEREGQLTDIKIPSGTIKSLVKSKSAFADARVPLTIDSVPVKSFAYTIGLRNRDSILSLNGEPVTFFDQFEAVRDKYPGKQITLTILRNGRDTLNLTGVLPKDKRFGFAQLPPDKLFAFRDIQHSLGSAIVRGWNFTGEQFVDYWYQLKLLFTSKEIKASESIGGIGSFASQFPGTFDWQAFWMFTAFISVILAFMNLLPIPGLDGGYVIFLLWELITGRKVNDKVMEVATTVGLVLLLGLMLYANGMDILKALK
jgi:regulator of sigma E protease